MFSKSVYLKYVVRALLIFSASLSTMKAMKEINLRKIKSLNFGRYEKSKPYPHSHVKSELFFKKYPLWRSYTRIINFAWNPDAPDFLVLATHKDKMLSADKYIIRLFYINTKAEKVIRKSNGLNFRDCHRCYADCHHTSLEIRNNIVSYRFNDKNDEYSEIVTWNLNKKNPKLEKTEKYPPIKTDTTERIKKNQTLPSLSVTIKYDSKRHRTTLFFKHEDKTLELKNFCNPRYLIFKWHPTKPFFGILDPSLKKLYMFDFFSQWRTFKNENERLIYSDREAFACMGMLNLMSSIESDLQPDCGFNSVSFDTFDYGLCTLFKKNPMPPKDDTEMLIEEEEEEEDDDGKEKRMTDDEEDENDEKKMTDD